jgi:hypothetical protein
VELADVLAGIDVNPIIAHPGGCVAVDAIVIPRTAQPDTEDHDDRH